MIRERIRTSAASMNVPSSEDNRRVIVRYADGTTLRGYVDSHEPRVLLKDQQKEGLSVRNVSGGIEEIKLEGLKAVFFVKTFEGSRDYSEFKVFTHQPSGKGVWVRVHFQDGEIMEGIAPNSLTTFADAVFSLIPPDPRSNNQTVLVSKNCLKEMQILGMASD